MSHLIIFALTPLILSIGLGPAFSFADESVFRAKGVIVGDDINGGRLWIDISGDNAITIVAWDLGRILTRYNVTPLSDCEQIYSVCLSATATHTHNAAATKIGDQSIFKIDPDNNIFVIQPTTGVLANTDVEIISELTKVHTNSLTLEQIDNTKSYAVELSESIGLATSP